jgi:LmbE family N-acetylglucosaminyl deacetylase
MQLTNEAATIFVPDGLPAEEALARTTHLCVGAHQDDQEFMAYHGIAECFGRPDKWFTGIVATSGGGSARIGIYGDYTDQDMIDVRVREQQKAAVIGEYACQVQLMYPSSAIKESGNEDVVQDLAAIFEAATADVVYLHNPADKHDTHVALFLRALAALRTLPAEKRPSQVYGCEIWRDLDWLHDPDKQVLPVDDHPNIAAALSAVFDSQILGGKRYDAAIAGRRIAHATFFESHATDTSTALSFAMDLTPLVQDDALSVADFTSGLIRRFEAEVMDRIAKFS